MNELIIDFSWKFFIFPETASLLAGVQPQSIPWAIVPWLLRAFLIIPVFQILGVFLDLRAVRRWRRDTNLRPSPAHKWVHIVLAAIPNLFLMFSALRLLTSGVLKFWLYYLADLSWLALICGGFGGIWTLLRTRLILSKLRTPSPTKPLIGQLSDP